MCFYFSNLIVSKNTISSHDFLLLDYKNNIAEDYLYHVSNVEDGVYTIDGLNVTVYDETVLVPPNLESKDYSYYGYLFFFIGFIIIFLCKYYY